MYLCLCKGLTEADVRAVAQAGLTSPEELIDALALDEKNGLKNDSFRRARWTRQLAEAHYAQGNLTPAQVHLEQTVALLGFPVPAHLEEAEGEEDGEADGLAAGVGEGDAGG